MIYHTTLEIVIAFQMHDFRHTFNFNAEHWRVQHSPSFVQVTTSTGSERENQAQWETYIKVQVCVVLLGVLWNVGCYEG